MKHQQRYSDYNKEKNICTITATVDPEKKYSGTCYMHIQKPFVVGLASADNNFYDPFVVSDSKTIRNHYNFTKNITNKSMIIGVCANISNIRF